jgi:hypothetical protein
MSSFMLKPRRHPRYFRGLASWMLVASIGLLILGIGAYVMRASIKDVVARVTAPKLPAEEAYHPPVVTNQPSTTSTPTKPTPSKPRPSPTPSAPATSTSVVVTTLPTEKRFAVPFLSQAPFAKWDAVHEETCEEASILMIRAYYQGKTGRIDPTQGEKDLQAVVSFELQHYGFFNDTSATETKRLIEDMFPELQADVVALKGADQIKQYVAQGTPVLIPADGKKLPNPNFTNGGPPYHMLVVRGYTADHFITNDPGTRLGENFLYTYDGLLNAIHDWNGGDVAHGRRVIVIVTPRTPSP